MPPVVGEKFAAAIGAPAPEPVPDASHFLQEDQGERIGRRIAEWLRSTA
jgi:pimeloyl-ACP methyl ester carboxylesterase